MFLFWGNKRTCTNIPAAPTTLPPGTSLTNPPPHGYHYRFASVGSLWVGRQLSIHMSIHFPLYLQGSGWWETGFSTPGEKEEARQFPTPWVTFQGKNYSLNSWHKSSKGCYLAVSFPLKRHDNLHLLKNQLQSYKCRLKTLEKLNFKQLVTRRDLSAQRSWGVIWKLKMHEIPSRVEGLQRRTNWLRAL